jgi:hypothetical protein
MTEDIAISLGVQRIKGALHNRHSNANYAHIVTSHEAMDSWADGQFGTACLLEVTSTSASSV